MEREKKERNAREGERNASTRLEGPVLLFKCTLDSEYNQNTPDDCVLPQCSNHSLLDVIALQVDPEMDRSIFNRRVLPADCQAEPSGNQHWQRIWRSSYSCTE